MLDREPWPAWVLDREGRIAYVNPSWDRVADAHGGPHSGLVVGTRWIDHIAGDELRRWCAGLLERMFRGEREERHVAECNTPDRYRLFAERFEHRVSREPSSPDEILVRTRLLAEGPIEEHHRVAPPDDARYRQPSNLILQCGGCRRVHVAGTAPRVWEFVPYYVAHPRRDISHGLCELCREVLYGSEREHRS